MFGTLPGVPGHPDHRLRLLLYAAHLVGAGPHPGRPRRPRRRRGPKLAQLYGINPAKVYVGVFVFSAVSAALAGAVIAPRQPILTSMGFEEVIITFLVVVIGGIGNILGGLTAGFGLGIFMALFGAYVSPAYSMAAAFAVLLVFLVVRPEGLKTGMSTLFRASRHGRSTCSGLAIARGRLLRARRSSAAPSRSTPQPCSSRSSRSCPTATT